MGGRGGLAWIGGGIGVSQEDRTIETDSDGSMTRGKVIQDHDIVSGLEEGPHRVAAYVSGSTRDQYVH